MPVNFLSEDQKASYGNYHGELTKETLARYFHLDDFDRMNISEKRGDHNRLGYAVLLCTVRYLGRFPDLATSIPIAVIDFWQSNCILRMVVSRLIYITQENSADNTLLKSQKYMVTQSLLTPELFFLTRWLYSLCWTGTSRPGILFERCTGWLLSHKVLLPGYSLLERYIARLRNRVENRLWHSLAACIDDSQTQQLLDLLSVPAGSRYSLLDQLRTGPTKVNATSLVQAIGRLQTIRSLGSDITCNYASFGYPYCGHGTLCLNG